VVVVRNARPIEDGDLFWHMALARRMLERGTLRPDHTAFSWTPASNAHLYCAWASELLFYNLWERVGLWSLFVFRYAVVMAVLGLLWMHSRKLGLGSSPLTFLLLMILTLASPAGMLLKPELFSFLFMNLLVWLYFEGKLDEVSVQRRPSQPHTGWSTHFGPVPLLILLWVNFHGGVIMAAPLFVAAAVGEALNLRFSPGLALSPRAYRRMIASFAMSGFALCVNPYGPRYPLQLFGDYVLGRTPRPDTAWNAAHQTIFATSEIFSVFGLFFALMALMLLGLVLIVWLYAERGERIDFSVLAVNLAYMPLFAMYLRATHFWTTVFVYSALNLGSRVRGARLASRAAWLDAPRRRLLAESLLVFALAIGGRFIWLAWRAPDYGCWLGFGIGYVNPVVEAEFLAAHSLGPRMYNIFYSGGYLLWRLYPKYKVMVDSRSFPYLDWFADQYAFSTGETFESFLAKYPADLAVIDLVKDRCLLHFVQSPNWRLVFYGPTAAVFLRDTLPVPSDAAHYAPDRFARLRNGATAIRVFDFATLAGDYAQAWRVLAELEKSLRSQVDAKTLWTRIAYREAHRALAAHDFERADTLFTIAFKDRALGDRDKLIDLLLGSRRDRLAQGKTDDVTKDEAGLARMAAPLD
jgi:hypothetical protein